MYFNLENYLFIFIFIILSLCEFKFKKIFKYHILIFFIIFLPLYFYLFGINLYAKWWLIDDHEIFHYLGNSGNSIGLTDFWRTLIDKTEIGLFGDYPRYRISYFTVRIFESIFFKENVEFFYITRFFIAVFFFFSIYNILYKYFEFSLSFLLTIYLLLQTYWSDIFSRLGPGEIYCTLGVSIIILVFSQIKSIKNISITKHSFISLGVIVAAGSKENFFILIFLSLFLMIMNIKRFNIKKLIISSIPFFFILFSIIPLLIFFIKQPTDMYGNSTRLLDRLNKILDLTSNEFFYIPLILIFIYIILIISIIDGNFSLKLKKIWNKHFILVCLLMMTLIFNIFFYNFDWPTNSRYDFPGIVLYQLIIFLVGIAIIKSIVHLFKINKQKSNLIIYSISIIVIGILINFNNFFILKSNSLGNFERTNKFNDFIQQYIKDSNKPTRVIFVNQGYDLEPLIAIKRFLNFYMFENKSYLIVTDKASTNMHQNILLNSMRAFSKNGNKEYGIIAMNKPYLKYQECEIMIFSPSRVEDFNQMDVCKIKEIVVVPF